MACTPFWGARLICSVGEKRMSNIKTKATVCTATKAQAFEAPSGIAKQYGGECRQAAIAQSAQFAADTGRRITHSKKMLIKAKDAVQETYDAQQSTTESYATDTAESSVQTALSTVPDTYRAAQHGREVLRPKTRENSQKTDAQATDTSARNYSFEERHAIGSKPTSPSQQSDINTQNATQSKGMTQNMHSHVYQQKLTSAGKNAIYHGELRPRPDTPNSVTNQADSASSIKQKKRDNAKPASRNIKTAQRTGHVSVKTPHTTAVQTKHAAAKSAKTAEKAKQMAEAAAKAAAQAAKQAAKATVAAVKAILAAAKSLFAALIAGGSISVVVILVVLMIGLLLGSGFGIFFANDVSDGTKLSSVVQELSNEYYEQIKEIEQRVPHDYVEYEASDGITALVWPDVLSVYAAQTAIDPANGMEVVTVTSEKRQKIRDVLWDMNQVGYRTYKTQREIEVEKTDKYGKPYLDTEILTETHLVIEITRKQPQEMAQTYTFNADQNEQLALLLDPQYNHLWIRLLGNLQGGSIGGAHDGEIMAPGISGSGILTWPLPIAGSITSPFGYRQDPFSGKWDFHRGLDIAVPNGTPILAAADGTVVVANATDSWGYSWGYYVKIQHPNGMTTLYAHCSAIAVTTGQKVQKGGVIAYVGSTGASTGNHLHWEVADSGGLVDGMHCL